MNWDCSGTSNTGETPARDFFRELPPNHHDEISTWTRNHHGEREAHPPDPERRFLPVRDVGDHAGDRSPAEHPPTNRSLDHFETLSDPTSKGQELINELDQLLQANRIDRLIQRCEGILSEKPLNTPAHYYLGLAWYHSGDAGKALEHLGEARRIDPSWKEAIDPYLEQLREAGQPHR
ncbi:MAG: tetratricopeptide repeat protein [Akkermansiaceae bacterium]|nr:tetratricopeptide repeat protein [Akkermansiaceae bacterium]